MKRTKNECPLNPPGSSEKCPLETPHGRQAKAGEQPVVVTRTERRSWITLAVTAFGAFLLRYLKTVRERGVKRQPVRSKQ